MAHWSEQKEKGSGIWQLRLLLALYHAIGARRIRVFLYPIVFFFFLFSPVLRGISFRFQVRVAGLRSAPPPRARDVFRHFFSFSFSLVEKIAAWSRDMGLDRLTIKTPDAEGLVELVRGGTGAFIICSHLGNSEVLRALAQTEVARLLPRFGITSIVDFSGTARFNTLLEEINPGSMVRLVPASDIGVDTIITLKERIAAGELVIIAGDRTSASNRGAVNEVRFLGEPAYFPRGAFVLASLMDAPVYFMFGVREDDRDFDSPYGFYVYKASTDVSGSRRERMVKIQALMEEFAARLELLCIAHPQQWYNFYDFWKKPSAEGSLSKGRERSGGS
jgi:predicted LPLAT superfamily acyltransferase